MNRYDCFFCCESMPEWRQIAILYFLSQSQRIIAIILRNKISRLLLLTGTAFLLASVVNKLAQHAFSEYSDICKRSDDRNWKEITAPGQIRTVRASAIKSRQSKLRTKIILLWTTFFNEEYSSDFYFFQKGRETFERYNCNISDCYVTSNKTLLPHVDAVLFHGKDICFSKMPPSHPHNQIWILYSMEAPRYVLLKWNLARTIFNWTMTYRSDSDIQVKYGEIYSKDGSCARKHSSRQINVSQRKKGAIWMVSNCRTESKREA
ncbi:Alpha-(1,3)-fucosyltransferase, partial [Stegodyphus mimosarum]